MNQENIETFRCEKSARTLGPKLSHGTSTKFADVRAHLRKVLRRLCHQHDKC